MINQPVWGSPIYGNPLYVSKSPLYSIFHYIAYIYINHYIDRYRFPWIIHFNRIFH
jgi:hypothetical protein